MWAPHHMPDSQGCVLNEGLGGPLFSSTWTHLRLPLLSIRQSRRLLPGMRICNCACNALIGVLTHTRAHTRPLHRCTHNTCAHAHTQEMWLPLHRMASSSGRLSLPGGGWVSPEGGLPSFSLPFLQVRLVLVVQLVATATADGGLTENGGGSGDDAVL